VGAQFAAFIKKYEVMPQISDIIKNPETTKIPESIDERHAICAALACEQKNWERITIYIRRLPKEMQMACISDLTNRYPDMINNTNILDWLKENKSIIL
jgi:hypothetical protein